MSEISHALAVSDDRPFFEKALRHGVQQGVISAEKIATITQEAPKGIVQIAETFGSKYLRPEIESARKRIVNLVSLYLEETSGGDLQVAANLIRDNTFLTLSRSGSGLLKTLFAMPEYAMLGKEEKGRVEDFLEFWSRKDKPNEYRNALIQRQTNALEIEAGYWFGNALGLSRSLLQELDVDAVAVVRTALLVHAYGDIDEADLTQVGFAQLLESIRTKAVKKTKTSKSGRVKKIAFSPPIPEKFSDLVERVQAEFSQRHLPKILDVDLGLDKLVHVLKDHYFIRDQDVDDTSGYDALVAKEWTRVTKGKTDIDSLLTLFLCICAEMPLKTSLTEAAAKTMVRKFRNDGFETERAEEWIRENAPHEKQESLLEDWEDFLDEANNYLLDDRDPTLSGALRFLRDNCQIEKSAKK